MSKEVRTGSHKFYKGSYFLAFYDKTDEELLYVFDNVREILEFQKREVNRQNINQVNVSIYRALKTEEHFTTVLTGKAMRVYLIEKENDNE